MADHESNSFLWFLAGLGVGAVVGVLYAPRSGDEMRDVIRAKAREQARRARDQATEWVDRGNDVINQQKERFRSAYEAGRQAYNETTAGPEPAKNI
jgi:gas vesicle protein